MPWGRLRDENQHLCVRGHSSPIKKENSCSWMMKRWQVLFTEASTGMEVLWSQSWAGRESSIHRLTHISTLRKVAEMSFWAYFWRWGGKTSGKLSESLHWKALIRLVRCPSAGTLYYTRPIKAFSLAISRSKITEAADIFINFICWYFFRICLNATKLQRYAACAFQGFLTSCFDLMWWCMCTDAGIFLSFTD